MDDKSKNPARENDQISEERLIRGGQILTGSLFNGVPAVVFAHKTTEGWEALLSGITKGGWVITASWPIVKGPFT